jgi:hypothetical protein
VTNGRASRLTARSCQAYVSACAGTVVRVEQPEIEVDEAASRFIRNHGGRFYVWLSGAGIEHEAAQPPGGGIDFVEYKTGDLTLCVDRGVEAAHKWRLVYHRLPRPHVRALWNGGAFSPSGPRAPAWEGEKPWS